MLSSASLQSYSVRSHANNIFVSWRMVLFLFIVFAFAQRFDIGNAGRTLESPGFSVDDTVYTVETGSFGRPLGMLLLLMFAIATLRTRTSAGNQLGAVAWAAATYIIIAILSVTWAEDSGLVLKRVAILISMSAAAFAWARRASIRAIARVAAMVCGATLILSVATELILGTLHPLDPEWRFAGVLHPVMQGWNCGLLLICSVFLLDTERKCRVSLRMTVALALIFLILSRSRVAFVSAVLATALYYAIRWRKYGRMLVFIFLITVIGCTAYVTYEPPNSLTAAAASFGRGEEGQAGVDSLNGRIPLWQVCLHSAGLRPILGYGYNGFFNPKRIAQLSSLQWVPMHPHSGYLDTLLGVGAVGTVAFVLLLLLSLTEMAVRILRNSDYAFALVVCVWFCLNLGTESISTAPAFPTFLWMTLVASTALISGPGAIWGARRNAHLPLPSEEESCHAAGSR